MCMSILIHATPSRAPRTPMTAQITLLYAGFITLMAVAQLFTYDTFMKLFLDFNLPFSDQLVYALAPTIIALEVFALPFLLRMKLSVGFRWFSMGCGWLVALFWFLISIWTVTTFQDVSTIGFLGTVGDLTPGWWAIFISFAFGILATWSSWGLWPITETKK